jgi:hypothetical protein
VVLLVFLLTVVEVMADSLETSGPVSDSQGQRPLPALNFHALVDATRVRYGDAWRSRAACDNVTRQRAFNTSRDREPDISGDYSNQPAKQYVDRANL